MENAIDLRLPVTTRGDQYTGTLVCGQWVHSILYGGRDGIIVDIAGRQSPDTVLHLSGISMGGNAYFEIVFKNGGKSQVPESILRGVQWFISECMATEEEIRQLLDFAEAARRKKEDDERQKVINRQNERERIAKEYPYLNKHDGKIPSWVLGAKNIKNQLAKAFPGVPFSVKSKSYTGGNSIEVSWSAGPTTKQVEEITNRYEEGHFDGMNDIYKYDRENVWPSVFGGALYVFPCRSFDEETQKTLVRDLCRLTNTEYIDEQWSSVVLPGCDEYAVRVVRKILDKTDIPLSHRVTGLERTGCAAGSYHELYKVTTKAPEIDETTSVPSPVDGNPNHPHR